MKTRLVGFTSGWMNCELSQSQTLFSPTDNCVTSSAHIGDFLRLKETISVQLFTEPTAGLSEHGKNTEPQRSVGV